MDWNRRRFLQAFGVGSVSLFGGCVTGDGGTETPSVVQTTPAETATPTATKSAETATTTQETEESKDGQQQQGIGPNALIIQKAGGADIWDAVDRGHFFYDWTSGDFDVRVRVLNVENTNPNAKGGIMARAGMAPGAAHVYLRRRPPGYMVVQWRPTKGAQARSLTSDAGADELEMSNIPADWQWMRLKRTGSKFEAYIGPTKDDWHLIANLGKSEVTMPKRQFLGLAATSHNPSKVCTVKYMGLHGVTPTKKSDLDSPIKSGSVKVTYPSIVSAKAAPSTSSSGATLKASVESMGGADSVDVTFQYRELMADKWQDATTKTVSSTGTITATVSGLTSRRYYQWRVVSNDGEITFTSGIESFATKGTAAGAPPADGPESAAPHDPADGFADLAPWIGPDTPIIKIREPSKTALQRAVGVDGPRVIVFETSGVIDLDGGVNITFPKCYIAGQTAPSPGITFIKGQLTVAANDVVIQHIRSRPGDAGKSKGSGWEPGAIDTTDGTKNVIIDHCSLSWAVDENLSIGYRSENQTVSNCLLAEPLVHSTHHEGAHGYTALIGDNSKNVSMMGNIFAFTTDRNPRLKEGNESVVVNNYTHTYGDGCMMGDEDGKPLTSASLVGNLYEDPQTSQPAVFAQGKKAAAYLKDNVVTGGVPKTGKNIAKLGSRPLWPKGMTAIDSEKTKASTLANAGARPADRSRVDKRILKNLRQGKSYTIDSQSEVGGYPAFFANKTTHDIPDTGLRAWLRKQALQVEQTG